MKRHYHNCHVHFQYQWNEDNVCLGSNHYYEWRFDVCILNAAFDLFLAL
jgi:hypothetical protein